MLLIVQFVWILCCFGRDVDSLKEIYLDYVCMCREFDTPVSHFREHHLVPFSHQCESHGFHHRWERDPRNYTSGGLHVIAFMHKKEKKMTIIFRHQEGYSLLGGDMWEAMSLFGRNFMDLFLGNSPLSSLSFHVQNLIFQFRYYFGWDYFQHAKKITQQITTSHPGNNIVLVGYSLGGTIAQLMALKLDLPAVTFAGTGVLDIIQRLYPDELYDQWVTFKENQGDWSIVNLIDEEDDTPKLDCQIGELWIGREGKGGDVHERFVYGDVAWRMIEEGGFGIMDGKSWSDDHGFCEKELHVKRNMASEL